MTWLLLATGFMGALTLVYYGHKLRRWYGKPLSVTVYSSAKGAGPDALLSALKGARHEILLRVAALNASSLTQELLEAKKRGVEVKIVFDHGAEQESKSDLLVLVENGLAPVIDTRHAAGSNQILLIDQHTLITGGFDGLNQAEKDGAENLLVIANHPEVVRTYRAAFEAHKAHSQTAEIKAPARKAA